MNKKAIDNPKFMMSSGRLSKHQPHQQSDEIVCFDVREPSTNVKAFLKGVITSVQELNEIHKNIGFLMLDLFGEDHSTNEHTMLCEGIMFYAWVTLPSEGWFSAKPHGLIAYDLMYVRRKINSSDVEKIKDVLLTSFGKNIYIRKLFEIAQLPFDIRAKLCAGH